MKNISIDYKILLCHPTYMRDFSTDVKTLFTAYVNITRAINFRVAAIKAGGRGRGGSKRGGEGK